MYQTIHAADTRDALGEGYTAAIRDAYYRRVPQSADFVMFWWYKAAGLVRKERPERFGFITTNTVHQTFTPARNRQADGLQERRPPRVCHS